MSYNEPCYTGLQVLAKGLNTSITTGSMYLSDSPRFADVKPVNVSENETG